MPDENFKSSSLPHKSHAQSGYIDRTNSLNETITINQYISVSPKWRKKTVNKSGEMWQEYVR